MRSRCTRCELPSLGGRQIHCDIRGVACVANGGCCKKPEDRGWGRERRAAVNGSTTEYPWGDGIGISHELWRLRKPRGQQMDRARWAIPTQLLWALRNAWQRRAMGARLLPAGLYQCTQGWLRLAQFKMQAHLHSRRVLEITTPPARSANRDWTSASSPTDDLGFRAPHVAPMIIGY